MTTKITILTVAVHHESESPVHGSSVIQVSLDDEGAGPYIVLHAPIPHDEQNPGKLTIDYATEWPKVKEAVDTLMNQGGAK